jgi:hypothetical protein
MLVQPDPHRGHLPGEISLFHMDVYGVHAQPLGYYSKQVP